MATIAVTGASGYLGSWVVERALAAGHTVHATVRSTADSAKTAHLRALGLAAPGRLQLFEADLLVPASFDAALAGADALLHTASPYALGKSRNPQAEFGAPAIAGTRNVLASAARSPALRRVVLTSSMVSMTGALRNTAEQPGAQLEESHWNLSSTLDEEPYQYSKTAAERLAWELAGAQDRYSLVSINPGAIFGPSLSKRIDAESVKMMIDFLRGAFAAGVPKLQLGIVDVRDVAQAHVNAALSGHAHGRYLVVAKGRTLLQLANDMHGAMPQRPFKLPRRELATWLIWLIAPVIGMRRQYVRDNVGYEVGFNGARATRELGIEYRSVTDTLREHMQQMLDDGLVA